MIIAGEISGDMHGAKLVTAIRKIDTGIEFFGIGGDKMRAAGVDIHHDVKDMAVMGFVEVLRRIFFFRRVFLEMVALATARKPDAVILVDYPGFNLRFAAEAHKLGIRVIYYICPQVWAWKRSRIPRMAETIDRLITIFPFEGKYFEGTGLRVDFAGHPLVDEAKKTWSEPDLNLVPDHHGFVALLPGSRLQVINRVLPVMWSAAALIEKRHPEMEFIVAAPTQAVKETLENKIRMLADGPTRWSVVAGKTRHVLREARAAMVASGTATIDASLMLCPMVIVYKMAWLSHLLGRMFVKLDNIGMVNILAGRELCPEFIQGNATPIALAEGIEPLLHDGPQRSEILAGLKRVSAELGTGGADENAARVVIETLGNGRN
jgi:lipid-A-disaccharide synthase